MTIHDHDEDIVEIDEDEAAFEDHIRDYRKFAHRVLDWRDRGDGDSAKAIELLETHCVLLRELGIDDLTLHLFNENMSAFPPAHAGDRSGEAAGSLLGAAEFLYRIGRAMLPGVGGLDAVLADLHNMAKGGAPLLCTLIRPAEQPFELLEGTAVNNLILQARMIAARDNVPWTDTIPGTPPRTLQRLARSVSREDINRAERIGHLAALQIDRDPGLRALEEQICRHGIKELADTVRNMPEPPAWRRRAKKA